ncbi:early nodulin-93-like [Apium graveolens]|uniref:early nodulin-93-like n=1 Tax=Apium graveolens TaxID=4045 RepID=UPI003D7B8D72
MGREGSKDVQNAIFAGFKSAAVTAVVSSASVALAVRHVPWAKANLNHTGRTLIVCGASLFMFALTTDQAILETQRKNTRYK